MTEFFKISVSLLPVLLFLGGLIAMDSYKLVRPRAILMTILAGAGVSVLCFFLNSWLIETDKISAETLTRYSAPLTEEIAKAAVVFALIRSGRVGFIVDAAVYGFAVGTGFAVAENLYFLHAVSDSNLLLWTIRGFGTAVMHGSTTAIFGIITSTLADRSAERIFTFIPGLTVAIFFHGLFNHFVLPPLVTSLITLTVFPVLIVAVFHRSEQATRRWLGAGFDTDVGLLESMAQGKLSNTRVGLYLGRVKKAFPKTVVADMLCLVRIHLELALRAKGQLLMKRAGFKVTLDPETRDKFRELKYLEESVGKTGLLAIQPLFRKSRQDLWQLYTIVK